jgi:hypothetical protein
VLELGKKTSGVWELSMKVYIPTGKDGYYNVISDFIPTNPTNTTWAFQVSFAAKNGEENNYPNQGEIYAGSHDPVYFNFAHDTWLLSKIVMDLDNDVAKYYLDGELLHEWQYSTGTFGEANIKVIDVADFFPPNKPSTSAFYVSDITFGIQCNFDDKASGAYVAQSYPNFWRTWLNQPGTTFDAVITNEQAASVPNSAKLVYVGDDEGTDLVFQAGNKTSGVYTIDFDMYIPNNAPAYCNLLHTFTGTASGNEWAVGVYFNVTAASGSDPGTYVQQNGVKTNFTALNNAWFPVSYYIDLDNDIAKISINGTQILEWQFKTTENGGTGVKRLAAADFYPIEPGSVYYIDNFKFCVPREVSVTPVTFPIMNVTPTSISETMTEGETTIKTVPVTVSNTGTAAGEYTATITGTVAWLTLTGDTQGTVPFDGSKTFNVVIDGGELGEGEYTGTITVTTSDEEHPTFNIACTLKIELGVEIFTAITTSVFPNPASDWVKVQCSTVINSIQLINNMGQIVYAANVDGDNTSIDTSNFSAGYYFIRVITNEGTHNVKLIIE